MDAAAIKIHRLRKSDVEHGERGYNLMPEFLRFVAGGLSSAISSNSTWR
jgi:hypothetical protein